MKPVPDTDETGFSMQCGQDSKLELVWLVVDCIN